MLRKLKKYSIILSVFATMTLVGCNHTSEDEKHMGNSVREQNKETDNMENQDINQTPETTENNSENQVETEQGTFTFAKADPSKLPESRWKLRGLYEFEDGTKHSLCIGQVMTLFGEADYMTENNEDMCSWAVSAKDQSGHEFYLEIYYGPSGPAIGGNDEEGCEKAADELVKLIMSAQPSDFQWDSVYGDIPAKVSMGVKDGQPFYDTEFEDGFSDMF